MCSRAEWEDFKRTFEEFIEEGQLRHLVCDAASRFEVLIDEIMSHACAPEHAECVDGRGRRSPPNRVL